MEAKGCYIDYYDVYNDRGSVNKVLTKSIAINPNEIRTGEKLPGWHYNGEKSPVVDYFDGETLVISLEGNIFKIMAGEREVEIFSALWPENIYVQESRSVTVGIGSFIWGVKCGDFASMFRYGSHNAFFVNALPRLEHDPETLEYFMTISLFPSNFYLLDQRVVSLLERHAEMGERYALYAIGRYHYSVAPDRDSNERAERYLLQAYEKGVSDAAAALAGIYYYGISGVVDREKYKHLLGEALEDEKSLLAPYIQLSNMIFGLRGTEKDAEKALEILDSVISSEKDGKASPIWYLLRGDAKWSLQEFDPIRSADDYKMAAEGGIIEAWGLFAVSACSEKDSSCRNKTLRKQLLETGMENRDSYSEYFDVLFEMEHYDDMSEYVKWMNRGNWIRQLEHAGRRGVLDAMGTLGDIYREGAYGVDQNIEEAWRWYASGAIHGDYNSMEKMYDMMDNGIVEKPLSFKDQIALRGARYGSEKLIGEVLKAYHSGRLTEYAREIELYYEPLGR